MLYVNLSYAQCIKSVWIWYFSCRPDIPAFGPEKTPNRDIFHAVVVFEVDTNTMLYIFRSC